MNTGLRLRPPRLEDEAAVVAAQVELAADDFRFAFRLEDRSFTEILRESLVIARAGGVDAVLMTCNDSNVGSAAVIECCGGVLEDVITLADGTALRRYWIARCHQC